MKICSPLPWLGLLVCVVILLLGSMTFQLYRSRNNPDHEHNSQYTALFMGGLLIVSFLGVVVFITYALLSRGPC
jgi:hypothetical protein